MARDARDYFKLHGKGAHYRLRLIRSFPRITLARVGLADVQSMKNAWLVALLGMMAGLSESEFLAMAEWVVEHEMWPRRYPAVLAEFEALGSGVEIAYGRVTGRIVGAVSVREVKARRAQEHVGSATFDVAYGDSPSDVPILELAREAVAVYPDAKLRQIAAARGWRVIETVQEEA